MVERLFGRATARDAALSLEYNWDPEANYSRASFADQYLQFNYEFKLLPGGWKPLLSEGDQTRWENRYLVKSPLSAHDIFAVLESAISQSTLDATHPPLKWEKHTRGSENGHEVGTWHFRDEAGRSWEGAVSVSSVPNQADNYVLSLSVVRRS